MYYGSVDIIVHENQKEYNSGDGVYLSETVMNLHIWLLRSDQVFLFGTESVRGAIEWKLFFFIGRNRHVGMTL